MKPQIDLPAAAGDIASVGVFALLARIAHRSAEMPLTFVGWLSTLWPFALGVALGWVVVLLTGKDGRRVGGGVMVWVITVITGLTIWGIKHGQFPHWSFMIVAGSMSALLMLGWRGVVAATATRG